MKPRLTRVLRGYARVSRADHLRSISDAEGARARFLGRGALYFGKERAAALRHRVRPKRARLFGDVGAKGSPDVLARPDLKSATYRRHRHRRRRAFGRDRTNRFFTRHAVLYLRRCQRFSAPSRLDSAIGARRSMPEIVLATAVLGVRDWP